MMQIRAEENRPPLGYNTFESVGIWVKTTIPSFTLNENNFYSFLWSMGENHVINNNKGQRKNQIKVKVNKFWANLPQILMAGLIRDFLFPGKIESGQY